MMLLMIGAVIVLAVVVLYGPQPPQPPANNTGPWFPGDPSGW